MSKQKKSSIFKTAFEGVRVDPELSPKLVGKWISDSVWVEFMSFKAPYDKAAVCDKGKLNKFAPQWFSDINCYGDANQNGVLRERFGQSYYYSDGATRTS